MKTYRIGVCDDDPLMRNSIKGLIEKHFMNSRNNVDVYIFDSAEMFLDSNIEIDYLFLDIVMSDMSGIELKEKMQLENRDLEILFVTSYKQYKDEAFGKNVLTYISKDNLDKITDTLLKIEKLDDFNILILANAVIDTREIFYLKAESGYINIITTKQSYLFCGTLGQLQMKINNMLFVQVHRSYIVNMRYAENMSYNQVILSRKYKIPISRKYRDEFKQKLFNYLREG